MIYVFNCSQTMIIKSGRKLITYPYVIPIFIFYIMLECTEY